MSQCIPSHTHIHPFLLLNETSNQLQPTFAFPANFTTCLFHSSPTTNYVLSPSCHLPAWCQSSGVTFRRHGCMVSLFLMSGGGWIMMKMDNGWVEVPAIHEPIMWTRFEKRKLPQYLQPPLPHHIQPLIFLLILVPPQPWRKYLDTVAFTSLK